MSQNDRPQDDDPPLGDLREFVYLDQQSVKSLLASLDRSIPETIEDVVEESGANEVNAQAKGKFSILNAMNFGGSAGVSSSEEEREQTRTTHRINDQYLFTILFKTLNEENKIKDINSYSNENTPDPGDIVKIKGTLTTDPLFRVLGIASLLEEQGPDNRFGSITQMRFEESRKRLYSGRVGLELQTQKPQKSFGMVVNEDDLWVDPRREFLGPQEYTVLGRKKHEVSEEWDLIDLFRVLSEGSDLEDHRKTRKDFIKQFVADNDLIIDVKDHMVEQAFFQKLMTGSIDSDEVKNIRSAVEELQEQQDDERHDLITRLRNILRQHDGEDKEFGRIDLSTIIDKKKIEKDFILTEADIISPIAIYW